MQFACPECKSTLTIGQPKPGQYRPKCKHCGKPFLLQVSADQPAKIRIGRVKSTPSEKKGERTEVDATIDSRVNTGKPTSVSRGGSGKQTQLSKTRVADTAANVDATVDQTRESQNGDVAENGDDQITAIPERLGGYRVLRMLGRGAMGAVYEAKQISLDRIVALKTIRNRLANNPASLARFTREAYAAAQLTHHNVVQIYDFGEDDGRYFFSMEWVRGGPLSDLIHAKGAIEPKRAAGYALQAARGLQFAHQHGMVHRDIKPANLLLSDEGVVKVADLGLVKIPDQMDPETDVSVVTSGLQSGTQVTMMGTAVGTPAYMAPEQGIDAASVDHRADIYSLGCSLFYMLTGRPPFDGSVVSEVMQQHAQQPLPDLVDVNARIPAELDRIVQHAMAKRPSDRYASIADMIGDLESYLGVSKDGSFSPTTEQANEWEAIGQDFAKATHRTRWFTPIFVAFALVCLVLTLVIPFASVRWLLLGPSLFFAAIDTAMLLAGPRSAVGISFRRWIFSLSWFDYATAAFGILVSLVVIFTLGLWPGLLAGIFLGAAAGVAFHFGLIVPTENAAALTVENAERFIRDLRIDGADEDGLRSFVARYAGKSWQPLYESLFGYESLCQIRQQLGSDPSFRSASTKEGLRDKVTATLLAKADANRRAADQKRLAKIEERSLASQGVRASDARDQAWLMAQAIVADARDKSKSSDDISVSAQLKRERQKAMLADARSGKYKRVRDPLSIVKFALGGQTRLIAGCLLLTVFAIWAQGTGLVDAVRVGNLDVETITSDTDGDLMGKTVSNWSIGIAGLLLCLSAFVSGWRMTPFAIVATLVILLGPRFGISATEVPGVGMMPAWMIAAAIGLVVYLPGVIFGETKDI